MQHQMFLWMLCVKFVKQVKCVGCRFSCLTTGWQ